MKKITSIVVTLFLMQLLVVACYSTNAAPDTATTVPILIQNDDILSHVVDLKTQELAFFWKDDRGKIYGNFKNLKDSLKAEQKELLFAMNGGMYKKDHSPQGLYIENGELLAPIDTLQKGYGNFYLQPNGIFYITQEKQAHIVKTTAFDHQKNIQYATQSGPLLLLDGAIHPKLNKGSINVNIRNGVGILPDGKLLFAMSKQLTNFYDFATFFKENGCKNALYLDGYVSKTYLPAQDFEQMKGNFGVIIGEWKAK